MAGACSAPLGTYTSYCALRSPQKWDCPFRLRMEGPGPAALTRLSPHLRIRFAGSCSLGLSQPPRNILVQSPRVIDFCPLVLLLASDGPCSDCVLLSASHTVPTPDCLLLAADSDPHGLVSWPQKPWGQGALRNIMKG